MRRRLRLVKLLASWGWAGTVPDPRTASPQPFPQKLAAAAQGTTYPSPGPMSDLGSEISS